jgi:hypothetical protein
LLWVHYAIPDTGADSISNSISDSNDDDDDDDDDDCSSNNNNIEVDDIIINGSADADFDGDGVTSVNHGTCNKGPQCDNCEFE